MRKDLEEIENKIKELKKRKEEILNEEKERIERERETREEEIKKAYESFLDLIKAFEKDYNVDISIYYHTNDTNGE